MYSTWSDDLVTGLLHVHEDVVRRGRSRVFLLVYPAALRGEGISPGDVQHVRAHVFMFTTTGLIHAQGCMIQDVHVLINTVFELVNHSLDINLIINLVQNIVDYLDRGLGGGQLTPLFVNKLFAEQKVIKKDAVRKGSAYVLLNQIIFYAILSVNSQFKNMLPALDETLPDPVLLDQMYFSHARDINAHFDAIFSLPLTHLVSNIDVLNNVIRIVQLIKFEGIAGDYLGKVFHKMIPLELRKKVASFYTLEFAATLLCQLAIDTPRARVCDLACGSGMLLSAAYDHKKTLLARQGGFSVDDHLRIIQSELAGIDIMPFATHLAFVHLALKDTHHLPATVNIFVTDSTRIHVGTQIAANAGDDSRSGKMVMGQDGLGDRSIVLDPQDVVLMNPPFTKKQLLKLETGGKRKDYRSELEYQFASYYHDGLLSGHSSLHAYFLCLADRVLAESLGTNRVIAMVLPLTFLRSDTDLELRKYLWNHYWFKYIVVREDAARFSEDTEIREMLLVIEGRKNQSRPRDQVTTYIFLEQVPEMNNTRWIENIVQRARETRVVEIDFNEDHSGVSMVPVKATDLDPRNLYLPISLFSFNHDLLVAWLGIRVGGAFRLLGDLAGVVVRSKNEPEPEACGIKFKDASILERRFAKGNDDLVLVGEDGGQLSYTWTRGKEKGKGSVNKSRCKPLFRYVTKKATMDVSGIHEHVIVDGSMHGRHKNVDWNAWQEYISSRVSRIALAERVNFVRPGFHHFAFYSDEPRVVSRACASITGLTEDQSKILALWFNSTPGILEWLSRAFPQQFGYCQHHKGSLQELAVVDESLLDASERACLLDAFESVRHVEFPCIYKQFAMLLPSHLVMELGDILTKYKLSGIAGKGFEPRPRIDKVILQVMLRHAGDAAVHSFCSALLGNHVMVSPSRNHDFHDIASSSDIISELVARLHERAGKLVLKALMATNA